MSSLGHIPTEENLKKMMEEVDKDNSGAIEFTEFCHLMAKNMKDADNEEDLMEAFKIFDADGSGNITKDELRATLQMVMGGTSDMLPDEEIGEMIHEADIDGAPPPLSRFSHAMHTPVRHATPPPPAAHHSRRELFACHR